MWFVDESFERAKELGLSLAAAACQLDVAVSRQVPLSKFCNSLQPTRMAGPVASVEESEERANELGLSRRMSSKSEEGKVCAKVVIIIAPR